MKSRLFIVAALALASLALNGCGKQETSVDEPGQRQEERQQDNIYQFSVRDGRGRLVSLEQYRGQVLMVINTATECGYTPQYTDIERIYETYREQGFTVLDFPCNQFGGQAPGDYEEINDFCVDNYHITFPQFDKIDVNGANADPLYVWLRSKKPGNIQWNFTKFLIDRQGQVVSRWEPNSSMTSLENAVKELL